MFIQVNERPLNVYSIMYYYLRDTEEAFMIYYRLTDGRILEESFASDADRAVKVEELGNATLGGLVQEDTYNDFPETGSKGAIYLAKDTGQMWFWDETLENYEKIGVSRKGGIYQYNKDLDKTLGATTDIAKSDLVVIVEPSVPFMDGSEVTAHNAVRGIITNSTNTHVTVRTVADMVIDSFIQVDNEESLPVKGELNVLYSLKDSDTLMSWDGTSYKASNTQRWGGYGLFKMLSSDFKSYSDKAPKWLNTNVRPFALKYGWDKVIIFVVSPGNSTDKNLILLPATLTDSKVEFMEITQNRYGAANSQDSYQISMNSYYYRFTFTNSTDKEIANISSIQSTHSLGKYLRTDVNYSTPFIPTNAGQPATKKYVDDSATTLRSEFNTGLSTLESETDTKLESLHNEINTDIDNLQVELNTKIENVNTTLVNDYSIFTGDEGDYTALTPEQKDAYLLAIVNPFARPTENILQVIEDTILDEEQTVTVVDLTDEEFEAEVDEIIGGV